MSDNNPPESKSFTVNFDKVVNVLIVPVGIGEAVKPQPNTPEPTITQFISIWDTGATNSAISSSVIARLDLKPTGKVTVQTAGGSRLANTYLVNIYLPNRVYFPGIRVTEAPISGAEILIGMDIICRGDFAVTHCDGKTAVSYRWPPTKKIDYVEESRLLRAAEARKRDPNYQRKERNRRKRDRKRR
jgi:predicted aspartyl protease